MNSCFIRAAAKPSKIGFIKSSYSETGSHGFPGSIGSLSVFAFELLKEASRLYRDKLRPYEAKKRIWKNDFSAGADWMRNCLSQLRMNDLTKRNDIELNAAGMQKYGLAILPVLATLSLSIAAKSILLFCLGPVVFYLVEVQMVFLFPLLIDGEKHPFKASRDLVRSQGGTWEALRIVLPVSWTMVFGGFFGQGFVRCWCIGCLAVLLWYEKARACRGKR